MKTRPGEKVELVNKVGSNVDFNELIKTALDQGASAAVIMNAADIPISSDLAGLCHKPRCENYGLSLSCPPHVGGPAEMTRLTREMDKVLVFKLDVPAEILLSSDRSELGGLVHMIAAEVEKTALEIGAESARGFAGGSCRKLFCRQERDCNVVDAGGDCRHPETARPSISGFGVHAAELAAAAGWKMWEDGRETGGPSMGTLLGMVLVA